MTHGPDAVHELVADSDLSYPISVDRLEREYALENIAIDPAGNSAMLAEVLGSVESDMFESREDLVEKLEPVFEHQRRERKTGILGRLKRLFGR